MKTRRCVFTSSMTNAGADLLLAYNCLFVLACFCFCLSLFVVLVVVDLSPC